MPPGSHQRISQNKNETYSSNINLLERIGAGSRERIYNLDKKGTFFFFLVI